MITRRFGKERRVSFWAKEKATRFTRGFLYIRLFQDLLFNPGDDHIAAVFCLMAADKRDYFSF